MDDALTKAKKTLKEIEPKPCKTHGKDLANGCKDCLRYVGDWFAHGYLEQNIEAHEKALGFLEALKDPKLADQLRKLGRKNKKRRG